MAIRKLDTHITDARKNVTVKSDPSKIDPLKLKLGKHAARHDPRTLLLASYATPALPAPPPKLDLTTKIKGAWGMMDNDQLGDCTCAAAGHLIMEWTSNAQSKMVTRPTSRSSTLTPPSPATIPRLEPTTTAPWNSTF